MEKMYKFIPNGVCSHEINFDIIDGKIRNVDFLKGCSGNLQGISRLIEGMDADDAILKIKGIKCRNNTSCPDQLAIAIEQALNSKKD